MRRYLPLFALFLFSVCLIAMIWGQEGEPKDTDRCNNYHNTPAAHKCDCARATECNPKERGEDKLSGNDGMHARCKTYCKPENCKCINPCST